MFTSSPLIGVLLALGFILFCLLAALKYTKDIVKDNPQMFAFIFLITILSSVWVVDNVIAFKIQLLTDKEDEFILHTVSLVMAYALGASNRKAGK